MNNQIDSIEENENESPALSNDIQEILTDVNRIKKDVRFLRDQKQDQIDISGTAQDIFDELVVLPDRQEPVPDDSELNDDQLAANVIITPDEEGDDWNPQTPSAIADRLNLTEDEVRESIEHLQDQFLPIVEVEIMGETHYFKEE